MQSIFNVNKSECLTCTNQLLKHLGNLQGVFGAEIDRINGQIKVSHTDEISALEISELLGKLGIDGKSEEISYDEASEWGCVL